MPSRTLTLSAFLLAFASVGLAESIELKTGTVLQGELAEVTEAGVTLLIDGAQMTIKMADIAPYQVHRLRTRMVKEKDAAGRFALAEYCKSNQLFSQARSEYEKALAVDPALAEKVTPALEALSTAEADAYLARGREAISAEKLEDALRQFQLLLSRFPDLPQAREAKAMMTETTAALKAKNEEKERQLRAIAEQKAGRGGKDEEALAARFQEALKQIEEGKKANADGLDHEGATKTSKAQRAYEKAVTHFRDARETVAEILKGSKDVDLLAAAKEKAPELDRWLVICYDNLGHLWAIEFNFRESLKWLNKALAIDANDKFALELKLKMAEQHISRNARGYLPPGSTIDTGGPVR